MHTRLVRLLDTSPADRRAWRDLADRATEPNGYLDPRFLATAADHLDEVDDVHLLVAEQDGRWCGLLAVTTKPVAPGWPVRLTTTGGTFMTPHANRHHPLLAAGQEAEALQVLLAAPTRTGLPGLLQLQHLPVDGPVADALATVADRTGVRVLERRRTDFAYARRGSVAPAEVVDLSDGTPDAPVTDLALSTGHLPAHERRNLRRSLRGLIRAVHAPIDVQDISDDPTTEDQFIALQHAGWKGDPERGGAALTLHPRRERWFRAMTAALRADGDLLAQRITGGERTLWIGYAMRSGGSYFGLLDAYDEDLRQFSPGNVGRTATLTHVMTRTDAPTFDPAFDPRYAAAARVFPDRRTHVDVLVGAHGVLARTAVRAVPLARRLGLTAS